MSDDEKEVSADERARRLSVEVARLARLPTTEWMFWIEQDAGQQYGVDKPTLTRMVKAQVEVNEKKRREAETEVRRREQQVAKEQQRQQDKQERVDEKARRDQERAATKVAKEATKQEREAAKEAAAKEKEKEKAFAALIRLPVMVQDKRLADLAQRLDIDPAVLKEDFAVYVALQGDEPSAVTNVEPWPEPVDTKTVLTEVLAQFRRYVVVHDADALAIALWIMFAWVHEIAVHSTYLVFTGPEGDEGKSTACGVVKLLAPRSYAVTEPNAANVYRIADHRCPTLIIDDE